MNVPESSLVNDVGNGSQLQEFINCPLQSLRE